MTINKMQTQLIGKDIPMDTARTDEGTPVSLYDFKGRALVLFLSGEGLTQKNRILVKHMKATTKYFLKYECSPVWISTDSEQILAATRRMYDLPFMIISDFAKEIHSNFGFNFNDNKIAVWVTDKNSKIIYTMPSMEPVELVNATLQALERVFGK